MSNAPEDPAPIDPQYDPYVAPESSPGSEINKDARMWAMLCHLSGLAGYAVPFGNIIAPLIIWLIKREEHPFIDHQGKEALNFQISFTVYILICVPLMFCLVGIPLAIGLGIAQIVLMIVAAVKSNNGEAYTYPLTFRLVN